MRGRALIGGTFAALLVVLVGSNLFSFARLESEQTCDYTICVRSTELAQLAADNRHADVKGRLALFHQLAARIPGATITIPPWLEELRWDLERIGRLRVVVAEGPMLVDLEQVPALRKESNARHRYLRKTKPNPLVWQRMTMTFAGSDVDYVIAQADEDRGELFLIPAARYAEVARR